MKNNNLKEKMDSTRVTVKTKTSPFQKIDPDQPIPINEVVGKAIGNIPVNHEQEQVVKENNEVKTCKAYIAGKEYFDQLKNNIKDCDPSINIDLYKIVIDDIPNSKDERSFIVSLYTKCDNEKICNFNVENVTGSWADVINNLSKDIVTLIKRFQEGDLDVKDEGKLLQKSMKERFEKITQNTNKPKEEEKKEVFYPIVLTPTTTEECPELEKAKTQKVIDIDVSVDVSLPKKETDETKEMMNYTLKKINKIQNKTKKSNKYFFKGMESKIPIMTNYYFRKAMSINK